MLTADEIRELIAAGRTKSFYKRGAWKRKRRDILKRDNHECQKCKQRGEYARAVCVHHKQHLEKRPDLAYVDSNLISLCDACHNEEHPEKLRKFVSKKKFVTVERW